MLKSTSLSQLVEYVINNLRFLSLFYNRIVYAYCSRKHSQICYYCS